MSLAQGMCSEMARHCCYHYPHLIYDGAGQGQGGNTKDLWDTALELSPRLEVQLTVIKEVSPGPHTGDSWETICSWAVISAKGWAAMGWRP